MSTNNKISNLVKSQVPFFVRNDHEKFISFIEAYYEYLEQANTTLAGGKTVERAKNLLNYIDVDKTIDDFAEKLYSHYLHNFPKEAKGDKALILKNVKDFYRAKGTQKSVDFLMRVLFNEEPNYYYPKDDILRASDGKWFVQKSLRISDTKIDGTSNNSIAAINKYIGTRVRGTSSNAEATIERTDTFYEFGVRIDELSISSLKGTFDDGEVIITNYTDENGIERTVTSNVFGGIVNSITIQNGGSQYVVGDPVLIVTSTGSGAVARIAQVSSGNVSSISVIEGGAGFQNGQFVLVTGGFGSGANAQVSAVSLDGAYHPTSYNIISTPINSIASSPINTANYALFPGFISGGLGTTGGSNANTTLANSLVSFVYGNTGPAQAFVINDTGSGYSSLPSISIIANTVVSQLGILGRMNIVSHGTGYSNTDYIQFINVPGGYGSGANANVTVNATGSIVDVKFKAVQGQIVGGSGYDQNFLPTANIVTTTGSGGLVEVVAVLGDGETLIASNTTIGAIERIIIENRGSGYKTTDTIDLTNQGDGTAQTTLGVVQGVYEYPGRWLNDDGQLSSYNFLQDRDYYQNYSYVVRVKESIDNYRQALKDLIHPSGMKLFGEYISEDDTETELPETTAQDEQTVKFYDGDYNRRTGNTKNIVISLTNHGQIQGNTVFLEFIDQESNVNTITILEPGAGYNSNGYLFFTGDGSGANASYSYIPNSISRILITNGGFNYNSNGNLVITGQGGLEVEASYNVSTNSIIRVVTLSAGAGYNVGGAGYGSTANGYMTFTGGANGGTTGANVSYTIRPNNINNIIITNPGAGYNSNGFMTFTGGAPGTGANIAYFIRTQNINSVSILTGGVGYNANGFMIFTNGDGTGANVGYIFKPNYVMSPIYITNNGGAGYNANGFIVVTGASGTTANISYRAAPNALWRITVTNGGAGYNSNGFMTIAGDTNAYSRGNASYTIRTENVYSIQITNGGADYNVNSGFLNLTNAFGSTNANVSFTVNPENVSSIFITDSGEGYNTNGFITFTGGDGTGANATYSLNVETVRSIVLSESSNGLGYNVKTGSLAFTGGSVITPATGTFTAQTNSVLSINIVSAGSNINSNGFLTFTSIDGLNFNAAYIVGNTVNGFISLPANTRQRGVVRIDIANPGSTFSDVPTISILAPTAGALANQVAPSLTPNMKNVVNSVTLTSGGSYTGTTLPLVGPNAANITPALVSVTRMKNGISAITFTNRGSGYTTAGGVPTATAPGVIIDATLVVNMQNVINSVSIVNRGAGYTAVPLATAIGANSSPASFNVNMQNLISSVTINNPGGGYLTVPTLTANGSNISAATFSTEMQNSIISATVVNPGAQYNIVPTFTIAGSNIIPATVKIDMQNTIGTLVLNNRGTGFSNVPTMTANASNITAATFRVNMTNIINSVVINSRGSGYTNSVFSTANGSNISMASFTTFMQNTINVVTINSPGNRYIGTPVLTANGSNIEPATFQAIMQNTISRVNLTKAGRGFRVTPTITANGSNSFAAIFDVQTQNVIDSVTINSPGDMFLYTPNITAIGSNSTPATFTANLVILPLPNNGIFRVQSVANANAFVVSQTTNQAQTIGNVAVGLIVT